MIIKNKKAQYDYFLDNKLEVGISFTGQELKSIINSKGGSISLKESYITIYNNEVFLKQAHISDCDEPLRSKKLLLHKQEIQKYKKLSREDNMTLIISNIYTHKNGKLKGTLCLAKGKKTHDKRNTIKERDLSRISYLQG